MGIENSFLRELPGLIFLALGLASQLYLGRVCRLNKHVNLGITLLLIVLAVVTSENVEPVSKRFLPDSFSPQRLGSFLLLFLWTATFAAAVILAQSMALNRLAKRKRLAESEMLPARRAFLTASTALCAAPVAALAAGIIIRKDFEIKEIDLKFPNLPKDLQGLRLVQISDIHMGAFYSASDLTRAVDASNGLRADIAFVTGDLISTKDDPLDRCLLELKRLRAPGGVWGCLGNHEQHAKIQNYTTREALKYDIHFLRHQAVPLAFGATKLNLVGVDHQHHDRPYLEHVEDLIVPGQFNLLLSHNPDVFPVAARQGFNLMLAGHTHGGQINLPILGANVNIADLLTPFTKGFYQLPNSSLYVNSGLGTIGVPVRLGAPPEITLIRLCNS